MQQGTDRILICALALEHSCSMDSTVEASDVSGTTAENRRRAAVFGARELQSSALFVGQREIATNLAVKSPGRLRNAEPVFDSRMFTE